MLGVGKINSLKGSKDFPHSIFFFTYMTLLPETHTSTYNARCCTSFYKPWAVRCSQCWLWNSTLKFICIKCIWSSKLFSRNHMFSYVFHYLSCVQLFLCCGAGFLTELLTQLVSLHNHEKSSKAVQTFLPGGQSSLGKPCRFMHIVPVQWKHGMMLWSWSYCELWWTIFLVWKQRISLKVWKTSTQGTFKMKIKSGVSRWKIACSSWIDNGSRKRRKF